jgi:hypothetical protein
VVIMPNALQDKLSMKIFPTPMLSALDFGFDGELPQV